MKKLQKLEAMCMAVFMLIGVIAWNADQVQAASGVAIDAVNFPDAVFRDYVKNTWDYNKNDYLSTEEIEKARDINVAGMGIASVKGVEYFTGLYTLSCESNKLQSLDVSQLAVLGNLDCSHNQLSAIDVSHNAKLTDLYFQNNQISSLNIRNNTELVTLKCDNNKLSALDLSANSKLQSVQCSGNRLRKLDLKANRHLKDVRCAENRLCSLDLSTLAGNDITLEAEGNRFAIGAVSDGVYDLSKLTEYGFSLQSTSSWNGATVSNRNTLTNFTSREVTYSYNCGKNKTVTFTLVVGGVALSRSTIPDDIFRGYLERYDEDDDGFLSSDECNNVTELNLSGLGISDLTGIAYFTKLQKLYCSDNKLVELDVSKNTALQVLWCNNNQLTSLNVAGCTLLTELKCYYNRLATLDVTKNTGLVLLNCGANQLKALDLANNTLLERLECDGNQLTALFINQCTRLSYLDCSSNYLTSLELTNCKNLTLRNLLADDNTYDLGVIDRKTNYSLETMRKNGFIESRSSNWVGAVCEVGVLKDFDLNVMVVTYNYNCGNGITLPFKLTINSFVHEHDYEAVVTPATCESEGYTTYTCRGCGDHYESNRVPALGHNQKKEVITATTSHNGSEVVRCSRCGKEFSRITHSRIAGMTISSAEYTYNGLDCRPSVVVKNADGNVITSDHYRVAWLNNKRVGTATVKVTFNGEIYEGELSKNFTIVTPSTSITSKKAISRGIKIYWKKQPKQVRGYQIRYSRNSDYSGSSTKTLTVNKIGATYKKITGLKAKKTYYIQIRTFLKSGSGTYYSAWSSSVKVKTKK